jgi:hypothetical protein
MTILRPALALAALVLALAASQALLPSRGVAADEAPATGAPAPADPAVVDWQMRARIVTALALPKPAVRYAALSAAVAEFDSATLELDSNPTIEATIARLIDALNRVRLELDGDDVLRNLGEVQGLALRLPAALQRAEATFDVARVEIARQAPDGAIRVLESMRAEIDALGMAARDGAIVELVDLLSGTTPDGRAKARLWAAEIKDGEMRRQAMSVWARARLAAGEADPAVIAAAAAADAGKQLLDLSESFTLRHKFEDAELAALAAAGAPAAERDETLDLIAADMAAASFEPGAIVAVHGITDAALRDRALSALIAYHLQRRRLDGAQRLAELIGDPKVAAAAWCDIGLWLLAEDYRRGAQAAADRIATILPDVAVDDRLRSDLGRLLAGLGVAGRAEALAAAATAPSVAATIRRAIALQLIQGKQWQGADAVLARLPQGTDRDAVLVALVEADAKRRRWPGAMSGLEQIRSPLSRIAAMVAMLRERDPNEETGVSDLDLLARVRALAGQVEIGAGRSSAMAMQAMAEAKLGELDAARTLLLRATDAPEFGAVLSFVAERAVGSAAPDAVAGDQIKAERAADFVRVAMTQGDRWRAQRAIVRAVADAGDVAGAVARARKIVDDQQRVRALSAAAEAGAHQLDRYDLLEPVNVAPSPPPTDRKTSQPLIAEHDFSLYALPNTQIGETLPPVPSIAQYRRQNVAAAIPAAAPGRMHIVPLHYSDYNKKFVSLFAEVFRDYGGRMFHAEAQRTALPVFIFLESGVFNVPQIARTLALSGQGHYLQRNETDTDYTLRLPIMIGPEATLVVSGSDVEVLRLNRQTGAYIVNAGKFYVYDTQIVGWDEAKAVPALIDYKTRALFRPFITSWSGSETYLAGSTFRSLGFGGEKGYGLSLSAGPTDVIRSRSFVLKRPTGWIIENSFDDMFYGFYSFEADDVKVVGNEYRDNIVYGVDPHDRTLRLLVAYNTAYNTKVKHGFIGSRSVNDSWFIGNVSLDNRGSGFMLDRFSSNNLVYANHAYNNSQDGLTFFESPCNIAAANAIFGNRRSGVKIRNSWDVALFRNTIDGNGGIGVEGFAAEIVTKPGQPPRNLVKDPYVRFASAILVRNEFDGNRGAAIATDGAAAISAKANRFVNQTKLFGGDLQPVQARLLAEHEAGVALQTTCARPVENYVCPLVVAGYLAGHGLYGQGASDAACAQLSSVSDLDDETNDPAAASPRAPDPSAGEAPQP